MLKTWYLLCLVLFLSGWPNSSELILSLIISLNSPHHTWQLGCLSIQQQLHGRILENQVQTVPCERRAADKLTVQDSSILLLTDVLLLIFDVILSCFIIWLWWGGWGEEGRGSGLQGMELLLFLRLITSSSPPPAQFVRTPSLLHTPLKSPSPHIFPSFLFLWAHKKNGVTDLSRLQGLPSTNSLSFISYIQTPAGRKSHIYLSWWALLSGRVTTQPENDFRLPVQTSVLHFRHDAAPLSDRAPRQTALMDLIWSLEMTALIMCVCVCVCAQRNVRLKMCILAWDWHLWVSTCLRAADMFFFLLDIPKIYTHTCTHVHTHTHTHNLGR